MTRTLTLAIGTIMAAQAAGAQRAHATGAFELDVRRSSALRGGTTHLRTSGASVRITALFGGARKALVVDMPAVPPAKGSATLVLMLDDSTRLGQVNLTYVVPGTTVARTVASSPAELAKFSDFRFAGGRLRLRSHASYTAADAPNEDFTLSWDVDIDAPATRR